MSTLSSEQIEALSEHLDAAEVQARAVPKITDDYPDMDFEDAYAVQWATRRRKAARGDRMVGMKMGLTSHAKMRQMGVEEPIYGFLADYFQQPEGAAIDTGSLIHPRVEAEIAFVTREALGGPGCHVGQVLAATDFVVPAVEIIDSRYENFRFDLPSVIADNASSSRFVTGSAAAPAEALDLRTLGVVLEKNGEVVGVGAGAAVVNHPAASIALLANMLASRNEVIPAGSLILSGGITAAVAVEAGDSVTLRAQGLGSVSLRFE
ncbi:2-hydroxyhexa-2,4-dienoate hydratase [wastewater metagenome]|uniref:2-hydroxyhexa-2,4-dienoate hydratase n=2 Tax=unclassified sequences TaxID=12908 RepID=A0A5B8RFP9_9ZZZZ|nr:MULTISPECIES: 2-oxo-3-hexenedioate decarboxylase [Arhodomonas]MCS4502450.1 2-oxo-3-hexenedioate decarboxylase [Arhodomonas aquaeolei]QEA06668.1 2-hydroxyhexa-2,4-dienoate hydratase [uncultured organism]